MLVDILLLGLWSSTVLCASVPPNHADWPWHSYSDGTQKVYPDVRSLTSGGKVDQLPLNFNLSDSQHASNIEIGGSFWLNSLVHGSNGQDYYIAAHVMDYGSNIPGAKPVYRGAIMGVSDPSLYVKFGPTVSQDVKFYDDSGDFNAIFDSFGMQTSNKSDPLQGIHTYSSVEGVEFDLVLNHSSPVLLNAALGSYLVNGDVGYEWSAPRGATEGRLKVNAEWIDVVPSKSLSWYDRQWGSLQDSFRWLAVNFPDPVPSWLGLSVLCVWDWDDDVNGPKQFATVRSAKTGRDSVVPVDVSVSTTNTYTSPETGMVYPSEGTVMIGDVKLHVTTPRPDQIFEPDEEGTGFPAQFSGYVEVVASKKGERPVEGYGAVDFMSI